MAATQTVHQYRNDHNFRTIVVPRHGVITLFGYGIRVQVDRGHLAIEDGIGPDRRRARIPRVGHGLRRLVVIGADGMVSLAALRWLADQDAAFVMLNRDGTVLATTGPVRPSDARLRRAQAYSSGAPTVDDCRVGNLEPNCVASRVPERNSGIAKRCWRYPARL